MIELIGIGTGRREDITLGALDKIRKADKVLLQTEKIPITSLFREEGIAFETMDGWYDGADSFDDLYEHLRDLGDGTAVCILGDIFTSMFAKEILKHHACRISPGLGPSSVAASLAVSFSGSKAFLMTTGYDLSDTELRGDENIVITEIDSEYLASDIILKLMDIYKEDKEVVFVHGNTSEKKLLRDLYDVTVWDYSTSVLVPSGTMEGRSSHTMEDLEEVMDRLLGTKGCPWDRAQTHETLRPYLMEEALETMDAIDSGDPFQLEEELGDLLYQIVFHAKLSEKHGEFGIRDVITGIVDKLIRRHPHVFQAQSELPNWEKEKLEEKNETLKESVDRIPETFTELMRFGKILKKLSAFGAELPSEELLVKKISEMTETGKEELQDKELLKAVLLLFWQRGFDPELAVRDMNRELKTRIMAEKDCGDPLKAYGCGDF